MFKKNELFGLLMFYLNKISVKCVNTTPHLLQDWRNDLKEIFALQGQLEAFFPFKKYLFLGDFSLFRNKGVVFQKERKLMQVEGVP